MKHLIVALLLVVSMFSVGCGKKKTDETNLGPGYTNNPNSPHWYDNNPGGTYPSIPGGTGLTEAPGSVDANEGCLIFTFTIPSATLQGAQIAAVKILKSQNPIEAEEDSNDFSYVGIFNVQCFPDNICLVQTANWNTSYTDGYAAIQLVDSRGSKSPLSESVSCQ